MSSNKAASNVIPMRDADRSPPANPQELQFERLLKECQNLAMERLSSSLAAMLDKVDDALWGLADQTHDRELRDRYIAAKDKALAQRKYIEEQFRANYLVEIETRTRRDRKRDEYSQFDLGSLELGLVNDEDLEETLKVNEMGAKLRRYCEEELNALDQRVGVVLGDANLQGEGNPFSPQAICNAYKQTCRQIESNLKIRMIFHKLFDDHVLDDVRSIYKDLNALLIQRSILPTIRYGMRRSAGGIAPRPPLPGTGAGLPGAAPIPGAPGAMPVAGMPGFGAGMPGVGIPGAADMGDGYGAEGGGGGGEQDFFAVLQGLIARSTHAVQFGGGIPGAGGGAGVPGSAPGSGGVAGGIPGGGIHVPGFPPILGVPGAGGGAGGGNVSAGGLGGGGGIPAGSVVVPAQLLQGADLIGSLTRLQHGDMGAIHGAPSGLDASAFASGTTNVVRELKATNLGNSVDQTDGMTMDIVAMLFDQIFGDKRVPNALKALIGRLQIPVVKVAVLDKKFFSKKSHPARRLLDTLGEFALGLDQSFDQTSPIYIKLENIVQRLLEEFEDNLDIFDTLQEELLALVREESKRAEDAAAQAALKIAYKEKLEVAKAIAQMEIRRRAETARMPHLVMKVLADEWVKLLLLAHARHGKDSDAWKSALETMDLLIWSVNQKQSVEERRKLASMLPGLLKRLQVGLSAAGTAVDARSQFFTRLMRLHTKVISGGAPARPKAQAPSVPKVVTAPGAAADTAPSQPAAADSTARKDGLPDLRAPALPTLEFLDRAGATQGSPATPAKDAGPETAHASEHKSEEPRAIEHKVSAQPIAAMPARAADEPAALPEIDEDIEPASGLPTFSNVTIQNPFGDGQIEVEEISLSDLPGVPELRSAKDSPSSKASGDQYSQSVTNLSEGDWLEFRDAEDNRTQAKLSYISPLKGTYLFVNRQGRKVGEYSLYELAREFRSGNAVVLDAVPLFDRAMSSLVGVLKKSTK